MEVHNMEYVNLGNSGLSVSKICLGCMSFGTPGKLFDWCIDEEKSEQVVKKALDLGINFFDTANVYTNGESEEFLGRALKKYAKREEVVIATKVGMNMNPNCKPNTFGLSRKTIFDEVEKSLKRLGTDYIDLYIVHHPDPNTPLEETMLALHDLVKLGKIRYIGASNFKAWQFAKAQYIAKLNHWTPFISLQNMHNLFKREDERELFPMLEDMKVSLTAYKVLNGGRLSRDKDEKTIRSASQPIFKNPKEDVIQSLMKKYNCSKANILIAYELSKSVIDTVLIGTTKPERLEDTVKSLDITLTKEDIEMLEN
jgi:1-deoxyxylulose-5-phosphate synthase